MVRDDEQSTDQGQAAADQGLEVAPSGPRQWNGSDATPLSPWSSLVRPPSKLGCYFLSWKKVCRGDADALAVPGFRNPVFRVPGAGRLQDTWALPYFFAAGYSQAGSTFFSAALTAHPLVAKACRKEYFYLQRLRFSKHYQRVLDAYLRCFNPVLARKDAVVGDFTVNTIYMDPALPAWLKLINPRLRLVVLLRDPVERAFSRYSQLGSGRYPSEFCSKAMPAPACKGGDFDAYAERMVAFIEANCSLHDDPDPAAIYRCASYRGRGPTQRLETDTIASGVYSRHVRHWLRHFPLEQMHFVRSAELFAQPARVMRGVVAFLGLPPFSDEELRSALAAAGQRRHSHLDGEDVLANHPQAAERLRRFYAPFDAELADTIGAPISW